MIRSPPRPGRTYADFVRAAAGQVRASGSRARILAGLSSNPPGAPVTSRQLAAAVDATRGVADGYWLNIPGRGARCPTCNPQRPDIAIRALRALALRQGTYERRRRSRTQVPRTTRMKRKP